MAMRIGPGRPALALRAALAALALLLVAVQFALPDIAAASPVEEAPPGANKYWYQRAHEIAREHHLGDVFVRQMMQESGFADDVIHGRRVSWAGAQGIAQIMRPYHPHVDPLNPEEALRYAARHMLDLLLYFDGSVPKALAAYNAGAMAVLRASAIDAQNWLQHMPQETQLYIRNIMRPDERDLIRNWPSLKRWWAGGSETFKMWFLNRLAA